MRTGPADGHQRPRVCSVPDGGTDAGLGTDATDLARFAGLKLDPWQRWLLDQAMLRKPDDSGWQAFEVGMVVSRQNGKGAILEARELAGLYLLGEPLQIHTAHEFKTCNEHFRRVWGLIDGNPALRKQVRRVATGHGEEGVELTPQPAIITTSAAAGVRRSRDAPRLRFLARSRSSARGFSATSLYFDEAMILSDLVVAAAMPTLSAVPDPQLWYSGSAGDQGSTQLARVRRRGLKGTDPGLAYFEWSAEPHDEYCGDGCAIHDDRDSPEAWAKANPGLGIRITPEHVGYEMSSMAAGVFERERLGVGDWPVDENGWLVIPEQAWLACADPKSREARPPVAIAVDVSKDASAAAIAVAGLRGDGKMVCEVPKGCHRGGLAWVVPELARMVKELRPCAIVFDPHAPAGALITEAEQERLEITTPTVTDVVQAYGMFRNAVADHQVVHLGAHLQPSLNSAVAGAAVREVGDGGQAWSRRATPVDLSPLVAVTLACWARSKFGRRSYNLMRSVA